LQGAALVKQSPEPEKSFAEANDLKGDRSGSRIRVLVVDDHEPFRCFVRATLSTRPELQIISEASDGLEAVQKAAEQQPDLIVLDIGLPSLNGIEAARRIRKLCPNSTILFLSQEFSAEVVREALSIGALGFVVKADAGSELLAGVEAVLRNQQFVSRTLKAVDGQR
jgi:DNA-binding NarL/FixJ family response regulator